jgi:Rieske Fe-S protein
VDDRCKANGHSRRRLLQLSAAAVAAPALGALPGCARRIATERQVQVAAPVGGKLTVTRAQAPELGQVGGAIQLNAPGVPALLVANTAWGFVALEAACTHAGCPVSWVAEDLEAECPCHGSRFASDGAALSPPATGSLTAYAAAPDKATTDIIIDLRSVVTPGTRPVFGPVDASGKLTVLVADHPELSVVGGSVTGFGPGLDHPVSLIRVSETAFRAFDATCTHQACAVDHVPATRQLACPCHGSLFDETGKVVRGPAAAPLAELAVETPFDPAQAVIQIR